MTSTEKINLNKNNPKILIFNPPTVLGRDLIERLIQKNAYVVVVSEFQKEIQEFNLFFSSSSFSFFDYIGLDSIEEKYSEFDYLIYFSNISGGNFISAERFLQKSVEIRKFLKLQEKYHSKGVVVTKLSLVRSEKEEFVDEDFLKYDEFELQRYIESLSMEYAMKRNANLRVIRLGEILGDKVIPSNGLISNMIFSAITNSLCTVPQDGLERAEILHFQDASNCVLKSLFNENLKGKILNIALPNEYTVLTIAYKIRDLLGKDILIQFSDDVANSRTIANIDKIIDSINQLGFMPAISLEKTLVDTINKTQFSDYFENQKDQIPNNITDNVSSQKSIDERIVKQDTQHSLGQSVELIDGKKLNALQSEVTIPMKRVVLSNAREPKVDKNSRKIKIDRIITLHSIFKNIMIFVFLLIILVFGIFPVYKIFSVYNELKETSNSQEHLSIVVSKLDNLVSDLKSIPFYPTKFILDQRNINLDTYANEIRSLNNFAKDSAISGLGLNIRDDYRIEIIDSELKFKITSKSSNSVFDKIYNYQDFSIIKNKLLSTKDIMLKVQSMPDVIQNFLQMKYYMQGINLQNWEILSI